MLFLELLVPEIFSRPTIILCSSGYLRIIVELFISALAKMSFVRKCGCARHDIWTLASSEHDKIPQSILKSRYKLLSKKLTTKFTDEGLLEQDSVCKPMCT